MPFFLKLTFVVIFVCKCGCLPKHWVPFDGQNTCCGAKDSIKAFETERRRNYPKQTDQTVCHHFIRNGFCPAERTGTICKFNHPDILSIRRLPSIRGKRCQVCTLPLPCTTHFPTMGQIISNPRELKTLEPLLARYINKTEDDNNSKKSGDGSFQGGEVNRDPKFDWQTTIDQPFEEEFLSREIVAAVFRDEIRYCYVTRDNIDANVVSVMISAPELKVSYREITLSRNKVQPINRLLYRGKILKEDQRNDH